MMRIFLYIIIAFLALGCNQEESKSSIQNNNETITEVQESSSSIEKIQKIASQTFDSSVVSQNANILKVDFYVEPNSAEYLSRNQLICDSFMLSTGNLTWDFDKAQFYFKGDTTKEEYKNQMKILWEENNTDDNNLDLAFLQYDLSDSSLKNLSMRFNLNYIRTMRVILNELSLQDLKYFQITLDFFDSLEKLNSKSDFIELMTDYAWANSRNLDVTDYEKDISNLINLAPLMEEKEIFLNLEILNKIKTVANNVYSK